MTIYIGTQGWSYKDWVGPFYPPGTRASEYLSIYSQTFGAVELDTTFYGTPAASRVRQWRDATPDDFRFTAKVPRIITHDMRLIDVAGEFRGFLDAISELGDKLGAILIQFPPDFKATEFSALEDFVGELPPDFSFAVEVRHRSWLRPETFELLRRHDVAWTMNDLPYMPITLELTTSWTYVRLLGDHKKILRMNETQLDRSQDLEHWAGVLDDVVRKTERGYCFVNNHYSGHSPADVRTLRRALGMSPSESGQPRQGSLL